MTTPSLDKRIATALGGSEHDPADLKALITEVEQTVGSITAEMTHSSQQMLDPMNSDFTASRERVEKAKLMLARFDISLPKLKALHDKATAKERLAAWTKEMETLKVERDELAERFRTRYCEIAVELIWLFDYITAVDKAIDDLNGRAHACGASPRMRTVECVARGVDHLGTIKPISSQVKLPLFGLGSGDAGMAWPRPTAPFGLAMMAAMPTAAAPPPTDEERLARSQQIAEQGRERERQKEAMQAAEQQRQREAAVERRRQGA